MGWVSSFPWPHTYLALSFLVVQWCAPSSHSRIGLISRRTWKRGGQQMFTFSLQISEDMVSPPGQVHTTICCLAFSMSIDQKFNFLDSSLNVKVSIRHSAGMIVIILINTINNNNDNIDNSNSNHNNSSNTACEIILITVKLSCVNNCTSSLYRCHTDYRSAWDQTGKSSHCS